MSSEAQTDEDDRIEQLEARIEELEAQDSLTSGTVPISRRGLLQGGAALGIGALGGSVLGGGNSGRVQAQTASGQVGTDSNRVNLYGNVVDAASVGTGELNNVYHAGPRYGGDIGATVNTILSEIDSGEIVVNANQSDYQWDTDVTIDPGDFPDGLTVRIAPGAVVNYTGTNCPITVDSGGDLTLGGTGVDILVQGVLNGENATNPTAAITIVDTYRPTVCVDGIENWTNSEGDAAAVLLKNAERWTEGFHIYGNAQNLDRGVASTYSDASDTATASFQDGRIDTIFDGVRSIGYDLVGEWHACTMIRPVAMLYQDGATAFRLNGEMNGMTIISPETESFDGAENVSAFRFGPDQDRTPLLINMDMSSVATATGGSYVENGTLMNVQGGVGAGGLELVGEDRGAEIRLNTDGSAEILNDDKDSAFGVRPGGVVDLGLQNYTSANGSRISEIGDGSSSSPGIGFEDGAGLYVNSSGDLVAVDDSENETTLTDAS